MYTEKVMDHFQHPRNMGEIENASGVGTVGNAKCGDIMRMYIKVNPEDQTISDVKFNTFGCGSAIATSSMATEMIKGKKIDEALELSNRAVVEALDGLPPAKIHCSVLAEEAVKAAEYDSLEAAEADDTELIAVIAAAIAAAEGTTTDGFVVRSIRKINRKKR